MVALFIEYDNGCYVKNLGAELSDDGVFNKNEDVRINTVTTVAAISRGKSGSNNPESRYGKLLKEAAPNISLSELDGDYSDLEKVPGRPLEFAPVVLTKCNGPITVYGGSKLWSFEGNDKTIFIDADVFLNDIMPFSYKDGNVLYTNMRALLNAGVPYEDIPYTPVEGYEIVEVKAPYFSFAQTRTHGKLSQVAVSERVVDEDGYWLPDDVLSKVRLSLTTEFMELNNLNCVGCDECKYGHRIHGATTIQELVSIFLELPIGKVQDILKNAGYKQELYNRWPNHLKYKRWIMGGYTQDPKQWPHYLLEREAYPEAYKSWVQKEARDIAVAIRKLIS